MAIELSPLLVFEMQLTLSVNNGLYLSNVYQDLKRQSFRNPFDVPI